MGGVSTMKRVEKYIGDSSVRELMSKDIELRLALEFHQEFSSSGGLDSWDFAKEYVAKDHTYSFAYEVFPLLDMLSSLYKEAAYGFKEEDVYKFVRENTSLNELMINEIVKIFRNDGR